MKGQELFCRVCEGAKTFFAVKMTGRRLFLISADDGANNFFYRRKMTGRELLSVKKMTGPKLFFAKKNEGSGTFFSRKNDGAKTFFEAEKILLPSIRSNKFCPLPNDVLTKLLFYSALSPPYILRAIEDC